MARLMMGGRLAFVSAGFRGTGALPRWGRGPASARAWSPFKGEGDGGLGGI